MGSHPTRPCGASATGWATGRYWDTASTSTAVCLNRALQVAGARKLDVAAYDLRELYRRRQASEVQDRAQLPGLDGILAATGVPPLARHTAIGDAVATALAYLALRHRAGD